MAEDEVRHRRIYKQVLSLSKSEYRTSKIVKSTTPYGNSQLEVGDYLNEFCDGVTKRYDAIWVVDRLTKSTHFLPIRANYPMKKLVHLYIQEIVRLRGVLRTIVSN